MKIKQHIPKSIFEIHELFKSIGKNLYLVGGCVRDFIIDSEKYSPKDFDLCTDATPDEVLSLVKGKYKSSLHGKVFAVVQIFTEDAPEGFEIATFRSDVYDGKLGITRNPEVKISDIVGDSSRRDLTINALYYDIGNDSIIDLHGGIKDIEEKRIKFVGDASLRLLEDPLRVFRAVRFSETYRFDIDKEDFEKMKEVDISYISKERIFDRTLGEFRKAFDKSKDKRSLFMLLKELGLISKMFGTDTNFVDTESLYEFLLRNTNVISTKKPYISFLELKISRELAKKLDFLHKHFIDFHLDKDNLVLIIRGISQFKLSEDILSLFILDSMVIKALLSFELTVKAPESIVNGLEIRDYINTHEYEFFKEKLEKYSI